MRPIVVTIGHAQPTSLKSTVEDDAAARDANPRDGAALAM